MSDVSYVRRLPQHINRKSPRLVRLVLAVVALNVALYVLLRLIFWLAFYQPDEGATDAAMLQSFYIGLKFDLRLALIITLPLFLLGWLRWLSPFQGRRHSLWWVGYFTLMQVLIILFYVSDFGNYAYQQMRLDVTSLRFLENPLISAQMIWQTYPVLWITMAIGLCILGYTQIIKRIFTDVGRLEKPQLRKRHIAWIAPVSIFLVLFGMYGKFSYYPLRWSDAFFSTHPFASALALNPVLYFFDTLKNKDSGFDVNKTRAHYDRMANYLGIEQPDKDALSFTRQVTSTHYLAGRPNIVMVFLESFAAFKVGIYGNPLNPTPHFDSLAKDGLFFTRFFTPHTGTARSVFTAVTGIPDVELSKTSSRNPLVVKQNTIINEFKGYEKYYFLGGSANWGNIRGILSGNIPGLNIYEEGSYSADSERIDVWGISDLHLFREANRVLRKQGDKPFFAIIQTAGNHRPYTIPDDNMGFKYQQRKYYDWKRAGFINEGEYNSFRFMDHSIGKFMEMAHQEAYFDNTLFVFFGDHGVPGSGEHLPKYLQQLYIHQELVPFVIYAPKLIPKGVKNHKIASEVDVLPTLAGLSLPRYTNNTLGRDLLDPRFDDQRYAFTIIHQHPPDIGLVSDKFFFQMYANGENKRLHRLDAPNPRDNVISLHPEMAREFEELCRGIYETARYVRFNNPSANDREPMLARQTRSDKTLNRIKEFRRPAPHRQGTVTETMVKPH